MLKMNALYAGVQVMAACVRNAFLTMLLGTLDSGVPFEKPFEFLTLVLEMRF